MAGGSRTRSPSYSSPEAGEVYFEFVAVGDVVKVTAIDAASGTEVSVMGPRDKADKELERIALRKLLKRLNKQK